MTKHFCDICGKDLSEFKTIKLTISKNTFKPGDDPVFRLPIDSSLNKYELCQTCVDELDKFMNRKE